MHRKRAQKDENDSRVKSWRQKVTPAVQLSKNEVLTAALMPGEVSTATVTPTIQLFENNKPRAAVMRFPETTAGSIQTFL